MPIDLASIQLASVGRDGNNRRRQSKFIDEPKRILKKFSAKEVRHARIDTAASQRRRFIYNRFDATPLQCVCTCETGQSTTNDGYWLTPRE